MNEQAAKEWLEKSWHNLSAAKLLYKANHYSDVTAVELHYALEKMLKSFIAYENKKIPKTHDLLGIYVQIDKWIVFDEDERVLLSNVSEYHIEEAYPSFDRILPEADEIKGVLDFAQQLFGKVCTILKIDETDVKR